MSIKDCNTDKKNASFRSLHVSDWILLTVLMLSNASAPMAFSCIAPFYNHVAFDKGMSLNESGIVFGVFNLLSCIASPFIGKFVSFFLFIYIYYNYTFIYIYLDSYIWNKKIIFIWFIILYNRNICICFYN